MFLSNNKRWFFQYISQTFPAPKRHCSQPGAPYTSHLSWPQLISQVPITLGQKPSPKMGNKCLFPSCNLLSSHSRTTSVFPNSLSGSGTGQAASARAGGWYWVSNRVGKQGGGEDGHSLYTNCHFGKIVISRKPQLSHLWKGNAVYLIGSSEAQCESTALKRAARPSVSFASKNTSMSAGLTVLHLAFYAPRTVKVFCISNWHVALN